MSKYLYDHDVPFEAFITNLGRYNEGYLVGEWVKFPTTTEKLESVFKRIGIGSTDEFGISYEEWFISDYDMYVDGIYNILGEYESLDELNYLASIIENMSELEYKRYLAVLDSGRYSEGIEDLINLTENLDAFDVFPEFIPFPNNDKGRYRMIDLFAGIGGTRLGFYKTNAVNVVFSSEWDKFAQKTYHANYGETPTGDITKVDELSIPDHDILVGGFPCVAFSQAGLKKGFEDTRGTLFFDIARIIKAKRPKAFLLENVKNLLGHDRGNTFNVIKNTLEDMDYAVYYKVFAAKDFGVPQNRERIYIVGFDKKQVRNHGDFLFPTPPKTSTRVGNILEQSVDSKYTLSDALWEGHQRRKAKNAAAGKGFGFGLFNENSPYTNTMSARYYKDGSEILIQQDGKNPRKITPREASRLQGFPEEFIIPVSDTQAYKQFGNSVAVPVVYAIARNIIKILDNNYLKETD